MKRTKRGAFALLLALCVALGLLPALTSAASAAETYGLYVGGVEITSDNLTVNGDSGTAAYTPDTRTLTLNNYSYSGNGYSDGIQGGGIDYRGGGDLRIALVGSNSIVKSATSSPGISFGIYFEVDSGTLTISGDGSLDISFEDTSSGISKRNGIFCEPGAFVMESGTVTAAGGYAEESAGIFALDGITFNGGTFTGIGKPTTEYASRGIYTDAAITINDGTVTAQATNSDTKEAYAFDGNVTVNGGEVTASASSKIFKGSISIGAGATVMAGTDASGAGASVVTNVANNTSYKYAKITPHKHSFDSYQLTTTNAPDDTITATCTANDCPALDKKATLTISAPAEGGGAAVLSGDAAAFGVSADNIQYFQKSGSDWTKIQSAPSVGGFFKASLAINSDYTIEVSYGVNAITVAEDIQNGTITAPAVATVGAVVPLTVTPKPGYELATLSPTKTADGDSIEVTEDEDGAKSFVMPDEEVTVSGTFDLRNVPVKLNVEGDEGTSSQVSLLDSSYNEISSDFTQKAGDTFILRVRPADNFDYSVAFDMEPETSDLTDYLKGFTSDDYEKYSEYLKANNISLPANEALYSLTMPFVSGDSLTVTVPFVKVKPFTILYQPGGSNASATTMWCKFKRKVSTGNDAVFAAEMRRDASMNGVAVWSLKAAGAFDPTEIAFAPTQDDVVKASMTGVTIRQTAPTSDSGWTAFAESGKFIVIGGNAKTFIAAFVAGSDVIPRYDPDTVTITGGGDTTGVTYEIAVCGTDDNGNVTTAGTVTAPAAPSVPEGFQFSGWRGVAFENINAKATERIYKPTESISIRETAALHAVLEPVKPSVKLNRNGGTGGDSDTTVNYGERLSISQNPTRNAFAFNGWTVSDTVTENGVTFGAGAPFDFNTPITTDLNLTAQWKHVHSYTCYRIDDEIFGGKLDDFASCAPAVHIRLCSCGNAKLEAHSFNSKGQCACGYQKPGTGKVKLEVSYGLWSNGVYTLKMKELPREVNADQEVSVYAFSEYGVVNNTLQEFLKWQYSTDNGTTWNDLTSYEMVSFLIPADMRLRALYGNPVTEPQVELSASIGEETFMANGESWKMDNVVFNMSYQLPDGYTFVDAVTVKSDNDNIGYAELKELPLQPLASPPLPQAKALQVVGEIAVNVLTLGSDSLDNWLNDKLDKLFGLEEPKPMIWVLRENSALDDMTPEILSDYMYKGKPVSSDRFETAYYKAHGYNRGAKGSFLSKLPVRVAQLNNGDHWLYAIACLTYKTPDGKIETIRTEALPATIHDIPDYAVIATPDGMANTKAQ